MNKDQHKKLIKASTFKRSDAGTKPTNVKNLSIKKNNQVNKAQKSSQKIMKSSDSVSSIGDVSCSVRFSTQNERNNASCQNIGDDNNCSLQHTHRQVSSSTDKSDYNDLADELPTETQGYHNND